MEDGRLKVWRGRAPVYALLAVALLLRIYVWKRTGVDLYGDMLTYNAMARHLAFSGYMGVGSGPSAFVMPLYPVFVALLYRLSWLIHGGYLMPQYRLVHEVYLMQQLLSLVTIWLIYEVARQLSDRHAVGLAAALIAVVYLPNGFVGMMLLTEAVFMPLLVATFWAFVMAQQTDRLGYFGLSGLLLGLTVLARPTVLPLIALFVALDFWRRRERERGRAYREPGAARAFWIANGAMTGALIVCMLPWWIRNAIDFHQFIPLSTEAGNPLLAGADPYFRVSINALIQMSRALHESQQSFAIHYALAGFAHHFLLYAGWYLFGKLPYLLWTPWLYNYIPAFVVFHRLLVVLGGAAMLATLLAPRVRIVSLSALLLLVIQLVFLPIPRYGYPIEVLWMIALPVAAHRGYEWLSKGRAAGARGRSSP